MLIYLASPFTHPVRSIRKDRYQTTLEVSQKLIKLGHVVFSPIVYGYHMRGIATDFRTWAPFNDEMLRRCDEVWVLTLPGWTESRGITHECKLAWACNKNVRWMAPDGTFHLEGFRG